MPNAKCKMNYKKGSLLNYILDFPLKVYDEHPQKMVLLLTTDL